MTIGEFLISKNLILEYEIFLGHQLMVESCKQMNNILVLKYFSWSDHKSQKEIHTHNRPYF